MRYIITAKQLFAVEIIQKIIYNLYDFECEITTDVKELMLLRRTNYNDIRIIYLNIPSQPINNDYEHFEDYADYVIDVDYNDPNLKLKDMAYEVWYYIKNDLKNKNESERI